MPFSDNLSVFLADFGWPVSFGSQKTLALFDQPDVEILSQRVQSTQYVMEYETAALEGLTHGSVVYVTIPGPAGTRALPTAFKCLGPPHSIDNGDFSQAKLEKV